MNRLKLWVVGGIAAVTLLSTVSVSADTKLCRSDIQGRLTWAQIVVYRDFVYICDVTEKLKQGVWKRGHWTRGRCDNEDVCRFDIRFENGTRATGVEMERLVLADQMMADPVGRKIVAELDQAVEKARRESITAKDLSKGDAWKDIRRGLIAGHQELREEYKQKTSELEDLYRKIGGDAYRTTVQWDDKLAKGAQAWANQLAREAVQALIAKLAPRMYHDPNAIWENIAGHFYDFDNPGKSAREAVANKTSPGAWGYKMQYVIFNPDVEIGACESGKNCGHYNSITAPALTKIGCGAAIAHAANNRIYPTTYWVCRYTDE